MSNHNYPFPPKKSGYWKGTPYTYEQAVETCDAEGSISSLLPKPSSTFSTLESCKPPQNSAFWKGETYKGTIEPIEPKQVDLTPKENDEVEPEELAHFVPVRYAIYPRGFDTFFDKEIIQGSLPSVMTLPEDWKSSGAFTEHWCDRILRQVRDGWIYVFDKSRGVIDEYEVTGTHFTQYVVSEQENTDSEQRGTPNSVGAYLTYPKGSDLAIIYSELRFSWRVYLSHFDALQKGRISAGATHIRMVEEYALDKAPIDTLTDVADIDGQALSDELFPYSFVSTHNNDADVVMKPAVSAGDYTGSIPASDDAMVVALHDNLAVVRDTASLYHLQATQYVLFQEEMDTHWSLAHAAMSMAMFGHKDSM
ncbi:hypothetical protein N9R79_05095, partial [Vibrio sp.]|nr:hypothetical protein [Vibrio sp.]